MNLAVPSELQPFPRVGTSLWKHDSWQEFLYPPGTKHAPGSCLAEYAKHLGTVEVDQWFWSLFPSGVMLHDPGGRLHLVCIRGKSRCLQRQSHKRGYGSSVRRRAINPYAAFRRPQTRLHFSSAFSISAISSGVASTSTRNFVLP